MKIHFIYCGIIFLILFGGLLGYNVVSKNHQRDLEEKIIIKEKVKQLEAAGISQKHYTDSVKMNAAILEAKLKYMENHPQVIIEKYGKEKDRVFTLNATNKVKYLANWLSETGTN